MTIEEPHFQVAIMPKSARHKANNPGVKDFTTQKESRIQAAKLMKSCSPEVIYSSSKVFMTH
jgi:hypothetical protein